MQSLLCCCSTAFYLAGRCFHAQVGFVVLLWFFWRSLWGFFFLFFWQEHDTSVCSHNCFELLALVF